ncbi:hypothetical protein JFU02_02670 [Bacillus sp. TH13]|nr:hypothetical protein [Bacillus sp. TH13]
MPPDNAAPVAPGTDISFPQDGPTSGTTITRTGPSSFNLSTIGTYEVIFQGSISEPGRLILTLNDADLVHSMVPGMTLVQTTVSNSILTVRNPTGNPKSITLIPFAGGTRAVSAHLVIIQIE